MIKLPLGGPKEATWITVPVGTERIRLLCAPANTAIISAAQARAIRLATEMRERGEVDALDLDQQAGLGFALTVKALGKYLIKDWEGVGDESGSPLEVTDETIEALLDHDSVATFFWRWATAPLARVTAEGNG